MINEKNGVILVTGGTGFVGSHLVDSLTGKGYRVRCLVRKSSNLKYLKQPGVEFAYGGLDADTDWDTAFKDVDTVYHVAGLTFARRASDYFTVNHKGTENILGAALRRRERLRRFVHISSLAAIGPAVDGEAVTETTPPRPITPYGRSKLAGEEALRMVRDLIDYTIVRPPAVYGPRDYAIFEFFKAVKRGTSAVIGPDDMKFSIVHVRDLVNGIMLAGQSEVARGRSYFISGERVYSVRQVNELLMEIIGKRARI
ncbi:MAG TPA: NAD-dependent epimerase/dehydratase family protein, partial [Blastocatellia bacterium]|nr:NAD-dependent epimerase/dehydratase family protein [Blastocatellia bacterium]